MDAANDRPRRGVRRGALRARGWRPGFLEPAGLDLAAGDLLGSTTHISVLDGDGMCASVTCSNGSGSGVLVPGTGVILNNMLGEEDLNPLGFHRIAPGRRVPSMMAPTVVLRDGEIELGVGSAGSNRIRSAILQTIVRAVEQGMRWRRRDRGAAPALRGRACVQAEPGIDEAALARLEARGLRGRPPSGDQPLLRRRPGGRPRSARRGALQRRRRPAPRRRRRLRWPEARQRMARNGDGRGARSISRPRGCSTTSRGRRARRGCELLERARRRRRAAGGAARRGRRRPPDPAAGRARPGRRRPALHGARSRRDRRPRPRTAAALQRRPRRPLPRPRRARRDRGRPRGGASG